MTEEEKEAIEEAKKQIEEAHNLNDINIFMTDSTTLIILLNYIEKLQKENEELQERNKYQYELLGKFENYIDKETIMKIYDEE